MKNSIKTLTIAFILIFTLTFVGCEQINFKNYKTAKNYYFLELVKNITTCKNHKITLLDTNFYKTIELKTNDINTIFNFMNSLKKQDFIDKPKDLPKKPQYKIFFKLDKNKFVINVYNKNYISIFPWDGKYTMDYVDMSKMYAEYNLYNLCKYLIPRTTNE